MIDPRTRPCGLRRTLPCLERRLQPGRPSAIGDDPPLELVDGEYGVLGDDIVDIATQEDVCMERVLHRGVQPRVGRREEVVAPERRARRATRPPR